MLKGLTRPADSSHSKIIMTSLSCWRVLLIAMGFVYVLTDETEHDSFISEKQKKEYKNVFRSIPIVFEYLLQMLEDKPEVLERNDVATFQLGNNREKRNAGESQGDIDNKHYETAAKQRFSYQNYLNKPVDEKTPDKDEIGKRHTVKPNNKKLDDALSSIDIDYEDDKFKSAKEIKRLDAVEKNTEWIKFQGADINFYLTPDEVAEQVMKVEKMLEDFNKT